VSAWERRRPSTTSLEDLKTAYAESASVSWFKGSMMYWFSLGQKRHGTSSTLPAVSSITGN
jgi:hypothetical protein